MGDSTVAANVKVNCGWVGKVGVPPNVTGRSVGGPKATLWLLSNHNVTQRHSALPLSDVDGEYRRQGHSDPFRRAFV